MTRTALAKLATATTLFVAGCTALAPALPEADPPGAAGASREPGSR